MSYQPHFTITPALLARAESIAALRERIQGAAVQVPWIPALQKDTRTRNGHASNAIEGNPLTLEQVRALEEGRPLAASDQRSQREVLNYFAGLRYVEKNAKKKAIRHDDLFKLHRILADTVMDQGTAGSYRTISVRVGKHIPPPATDVSGLMFELLEWWNKESQALSPVLSSAIVHYQFEAIHPFADGNGRTGRALALWELYRRGFDSHHIFAVDEFYGEDRPRYYAALDAFEKATKDAHPIYENAKGIISSHQGFDNDGKVTDIEKAKETVKSMGEKMKEIKDAMGGTGQIHIHLFEGKLNQLVIEISDSGKGISPKNTSKIFSPGFSTKKRGWGLGLTLAKRIVENYHEGKLTLKSTELNKGSTFRIVLPKPS